MNQMEEVKKALQEDGITFAAISSKGELRTSSRRGIAPIMEILALEDGFFKGAVVADRVIGRAAALLLSKGKIQALHANVLSAHAEDALGVKGIPFSYDEKVPYIINRTGDGMCPMEAATLGEIDEEIAYVSVKKKIAELMAK